MLSAERSLMVSRTQAEVWDFVASMSNWARQMPGYISHEEVNESASVWTVQVNVGPFQRPVVIDVDVTQWSPPSDVFFKIKGRVEPFHGGGRFHTEANGARTSINLQFEAEPTGPMATMLTGLARPVLDRVADEFSSNLCKALDPDHLPGRARTEGSTASQSKRQNWLRRIVSWCTGKKARDQVTGL